MIKTGPKVLKNTWYTCKTWRNNCACRFIHSNEDNELSKSVEIHKHRLSRPQPKLSSSQRQELLSTRKGSLVKETLQEMETNPELQEILRQLKKDGQAKLTKQERLRRQRALNKSGIPDFNDFLKEQGSLVKDGLPLTRRGTEIFQMNIGLYCNQACSHCHVESSPKRTEMMDRKTAQRCMDLLQADETVHTVDITGGAPELCEQFRFIVNTASGLGKTVIDRCNLTALREPGQEDTAKFLAEKGVQVIASLPCYSAKNVNLQRGKNVFQKSIQALFDLNDLGYGKEGSGLELHLVYNPLGAFLPPNQGDLEQKYKQELWEEFGIEFNKLFVMTNMPIKRFADFLYRRNELEDYMALLARNFNIHTLENLMCRNVLSVGYDGRIYDCDFNQQLEIPMMGGSKHSVFDIGSIAELTGNRVATDNHCFGCTAGQGSS